MIKGAAPAPVQCRLSSFGASGTIAHALLGYGDYFFMTEPASAAELELFCPDAGPSSRFRLQEAPSCIKETFRLYLIDVL